VKAESYFAFTFSKALSFLLSASSFFPNFVLPFIKQHYIGAPGINHR
jgi:hypothetical protein